MSKNENPDAPKAEVQPDPIPPAPKPVSACKVLEEILGRGPQGQQFSVSGGWGHTNNGVWFKLPKNDVVSYDEELLLLKRAKIACDRGLVENPVAPGRFLPPEEHDKTHNDAWQKRFDQKKADEQRRKARREEGCGIQ